VAKALRDECSGRGCTGVRNSQDLWISVSSDSLIASLILLGSLEESALLEDGSGAEQRDEIDPRVLDEASLSALDDPRASLIVLPPVSGTLGRSGIGFSVAMTSPAERGSCSVAGSAAVWLTSKSA
jgi:hypothetical protein